MPNPTMRLRAAGVETDAVGWYIPDGNRLVNPAYPDLDPPVAVDLNASPPIVIDKNACGVEPEASPAVNLGDAELPPKREIGDGLPPIDLTMDTGYLNNIKSVYHSPLMDFVDPA